MNVYAVIDTNVLVSALLSRNADAATVRVFQAIERRLIRPLIHEEIIREYAEVLNRPKFSSAIPSSLANAVVKTLQELGLPSERVPSIEDFPDPKDIVFYEVALSKEDAFLVTGNAKHFPRKPIVVSPAEMLQILKDRLT